MRKWHRWLMVFSAVLMLWIGMTGTLAQVIALAGGDERHGPPQQAQAAKPAETVSGNPVSTVSSAGQPNRSVKPDEKRGPPEDLYHLIIALHSGNIAGPVGKVISALMGAALAFFSISGMWLYIDMFLRRRRAGKTGLFWE